LASGIVWTVAKNLAPTVNRSPDRPALGSRYTDYATRPTSLMYEYSPAIKSYLYLPSARLVPKVADYTVLVF